MHTGPLALQKLLVAASRAHAPAHATASGAAPSLDGRRQPLPWSLGVAPWVLLAAALGRAPLGERSVRSMRGLAPLAPPGLVLSATAAETINEEQKRGNENPV